MKERLLGVALGCLLAVPALAGIKAQSASSNGGIVDVSCNSILGNLGLLTDWTHVKQDDFWLTSSDGETGAEWNGGSYPGCGGTQNSSTDSAIHTWMFQYFTGKDKIRVRLNSEAVASGVASRFSDGPGPIPDTQWWWNPTVTVSDQAPSVKKYAPDGTEIGSIGYQNNPADPYDPVNFRGIGGVGSPGAPPNGTLSAGFAANGNNNTSSSMDAETNSIGLLSGQTVKVTYSVTSVAGPDADNAQIDNWRVYLRSNLDTTGVP